MDPAEGAQGAIRVEVAFSPRPGEVQRLMLTLSAGATVADAVAQAVVRGGWVPPEDVRTAVWSRPRAAGEALRDLDRLELLRPLRVDPKEARRQRYRSHRAGKP